MRTQRTDNELRGMVTGNSDRLNDDELDIVVWALSQDLKGDMGLRSNAGVYEVSGNYEPIKPRKDKAGVVTSMYVKKAKGSSKKNEMGDRMLQAAAVDRAARSMLEAIGPVHRRTLWRCYVTPYPEGLRASLAAFADLAPLVPGTRAAAAARARARAERGDKSRNDLVYCQGLSERILKAQDSGAEVDELDRLAMQAIVDEAEPVLGDACRAAKKALRNYRDERRRAAAQADTSTSTSRPQE